MNCFAKIPSLAWLFSVKVRANAQTNPKNPCSRAEIESLWIELTKNKILYRSEYRGTKEMDLLLSNFVKKYINVFDIDELKQLDELINFDDDSLFKWYLNKKNEIKIPNNKVWYLLRNFKI